MLKKISIVTILMVCILIGSGFAEPNPKNMSGKTLPQKSSEASLTKQLSLFVDYGYFQPSLKQLNDGIAALNTRLQSSEFVNQSGSLAETGGEPYVNFGMRYFFRPDLSLSLSIGHLTTDLENSYHAEIQDKEPMWPDRDINISHSLGYSSEIRINPALFTLQYSLPFSPMKDQLELYVGGGLGFYFSSIVSDVDWKYESVYSNGKGIFADSVETYSSDLIANVRANANPLGYHLVLGGNFQMGVLTFHLEMTYNYAKAKIDEDEWLFFTQKQSYQDAVPESYFEELKIDELDFGGFLFKGGIGLTF